MNFKKLSSFIIIFGVGLLIYGVFVYDSFKPELATLKGSEGFINLINAEAREQSTDKAKTLLIFGGVILFIGIAIRLSSKGDSKELSQEILKNDLFKTTTKKVSSYKQTKFWASLLIFFVGLALVLLFYKTVIQNTMSIKEVAESIQIVWHDSLWVDKKGKPDEAVIVPSFTFKIKNTGSRPLQHVNFKCVFNFEESGECLTDGFINTIKKPLAPGQVSDEIFIKGFFGYQATSKAAFLKNISNWQNIKMKIFIVVDEDHVDHFSDQGQVLLGVFPIQKKIAGIKNNY